jgi:hypothetical protein
VKWLALLLVVFAAPAWAAPADSTYTTVILVRHAEKNPHPAGGDAGLNTQGLLRARELARTLEGAPYDGLWVLTLRAGGESSLVRLRYGAKAAG